MRGSGASGFVILLAFWLIGVLALTVFWPSTRPGRLPAPAIDTMLTAQDGADGTTTTAR